MPIMFVFGSKRAEQIGREDGTEGDKSRRREYERLRRENLCSVPPDKWIHEMRALSVIRARHKAVSCLFSRAQCVELAFLVDCTGTMVDYIDVVKHRIGFIVDELRRRYRHLKLRLAFVGYRDFSNGDDRLAVLPFTKDVERFKAFVGKQKAISNGDNPEDVFGGLDAALKLDWSAHTRVLIHVADDPCHGARFQPPEWGDVPRWGDLEENRLDEHGRDRNGLRAEELIPKIKDKRIIAFFCHVARENTAVMVREFNKIAVAARKEPAFAEVNLAATTGKLDTVIVSSVSKSVSVTVSNLGKGMVTSCGVTTNPARTTKDLIDWSYVHSETAIEMQCEAPNSIRDLYSGMPINKRQCTITVKIAPSPFAEGSSRQAFHALAVSGSEKTKMVMKVWKDAGNNLAQYEQQMEAQSVAEYLAMKFNACFEQANCSPRGMRLEFVRARTINLANRERPLYANFEPMIDGKFTKFNNNSGHFADNHDLLQAFSHWTHHITQGSLIVVDLQGLKKGNRYILTDPAIHSVDMLVKNGHGCFGIRFGETNLGKHGINAFFASHKCNAICNALLPSNWS